MALRLLVLGVVLLSFSQAWSSEETARLLTVLSEEVMQLLDRKEFEKLWEMSDHDGLMSSKDGDLRTMRAIYGQVTFFFEKPVVKLTTPTTATACIKVTYFSSEDILAGYKFIYWELKRGRWFLYHWRAVPNCDF